MTQGPSHDPLHTFLNAFSFQYAAQALNDHPRHKDHLVRPTMVNEAFALELFIKCLTEVKGSKAHGHDAHELFHNLEPSDCKRVEGHYDRIIAAHPHAIKTLSEGIPLDVESVLLRARNMFVASRYWHEGIPLKTDSKGFATNAGIGSLSDAVRDYLFELNPGWPGKLKTFKWKFPGNTKLTT